MSTILDDAEAALNRACAPMPDGDYWPLRKALKRLRALEEADERLRAGARRERNRGNDPMGPST